MDLPRFLELLRARRLLIIRIVGAVVLLVLVWSWAQPSRYHASADLLFGRSPGAEVVVAGGTSGTGDIPETTAATNLALASLDRVAARVKTRLRSPLSVDEIKSAVDVTLQGDSDIANVTAEAETPQQAARLADVFAEEIVALRREASRADIQRAIDALERTLAAQPAPTPVPGAAPGTPAPESEAVRTLRERISELQVLKALETGGVYVVEPATPPTSASSPRPLRNAFVAGLLALALSILVVVLLARFSERIQDEDELAELLEAPILARIPDRVRSRRLARPAGPHDDQAFLEAFEFLRQNLQLIEFERGPMVAAVTSAAHGDGKTTVVSWLARSLAAGDGEVIAVDLDVRKPELHKHLNAFDQPFNGAPPGRRGDTGEQLAAGADGRRRIHSTEEVEAGLRELVRRGGNARSAARSLKSAGRDIPESTLRRWKVQHAPLYEELGEERRGRSSDGATVADDPTRPTAHARVRLLSRGDQLAQPLRRERLHRLFDQLKDDADYVLVDTVPVSTVADASAVVAAAHGVLLVVDLERSRRRDLLAAKKQLDYARAEVLGIVLNRAAVSHLGHEPGDHDEPRADEPSR